MAGPALYKHFASKDAVLAEMLVAISEHLLAEGGSGWARRSPRRARSPRWSTGTSTFALAQPALIVVQDRDWQSLPVEARERVRASSASTSTCGPGQRRTAGIDLDQGRAMARDVRADQLHPHSLLPPRTCTVLADTGLLVAQVDERRQPTGAIYPDGYAVGTPEGPRRSSCPPWWA